MNSNFSSRQEWVRSFLQCPQCGAKEISFYHNRLCCNNCGRIYRVISDRCVFHDDFSISHVEYNRQSFRVPLRFIEIIRRNGGLGLNMGCGAQPENMDFIIDFDYILCPNTDVVGDAHALPFRDKQFQTILSLNVFEHLRDPCKAVHEIQRVCEKGGHLIIHTAFMQPQHDFSHYFNATRAGIREWFTPFFSERSCFVSPNFTVEKTIAWAAHDFLKMVRKYCPKITIERFEKMTLGELALTWQNLYSSEAEELYKMVRDIPEEVQGELALGFEFIGEKK